MQPPIVVIYHGTNITGVIDNPLDLSDGELGHRVKCAVVADHAIGHGTYQLSNKPKKTGIFVVNPENKEGK